MSIYKRGALWWVKISSPGHPTVRESARTSDRAAAQEYHDKRAAELWRIRRLGERPRAPLAGCIADWIESHAQYKRSFEDERMHLTLKRETTRPPGANSLQQQAKFDAFVSEFNSERPHEALKMKMPAEVYTPLPRTFQGLPPLSYPLHDREVLVTACGRICMHRKRINLSTVLAGQRVGIKEVDEGIWIVSFMHYDLGFIDLEQKTLQPLDNPFGSRLLPMS